MKEKPQRIIIDLDVDVLPPEDVHVKMPYIRAALEVEKANKLTLAAEKLSEHLGRKVYATVGLIAEALQEWDRKKLEDQKLQHEELKDIL